jgi:hypothetical protein
VKGLGSFALVAVAVLIVLRIVHLSVPLVFPSTRLGPIIVATMDEARDQLGFAPIVPTYRPAAIGDKPIRITVVFSPTPTLIVAWRNGGDYLSITQQRGGPKPVAPPDAGPLADVPDSTWWMNGPEHHVIVSRVGFWIEITTNLSTSELQKFANTLVVY